MRTIIIMIVLILIASLLYAAVEYGQERIVDFKSEMSLVTLNEQIREIRATLNDHESRLKSDM